MSSSFGVSPTQFGAANTVQVAPAGSRRPMSLRHEWRFSEKAGIDDTGTNDSSTVIQEFLQDAVEAGKPVIAGEGVYACDQPVYQPAYAGGPLHLAGEGWNRTRFLHGANQQTLIGLPKGALSATVALTAPVGPNDSVLQTANGAAFQPGQRIYLRDTSQPVYAGSARGQAYCVGCVRTVLSVDGNAVTIEGRLGRTLTTSTVIQTMTSPMAGTVLEGFTIENPTPSDQGPRSRGIALNYITDVTLRELRGVGLDDDFIRTAFCWDSVFDWIDGRWLQDMQGPAGKMFEIAADITATDTTIPLRAVGGGAADFSGISPLTGQRVTISPDDSEDTDGPRQERLVADPSTDPATPAYTTINTTLGQIEGARRDATTAQDWPAGTIVNIGFSGTPYQIGVGDASWNLTVANLRGRGGRHAITSVMGSPTLHTAPGAVNVIGAVLSSFSHAALDTHPYAQEWNFADYLIDAAGTQGIQIRGQRCRVGQGMIIGGDVGIGVSFGADRTVIDGPTIVGADVAIKSTASSRLKVDNYTARNIQTSVFLFDNDPEYPDAMLVEIGRGTVDGNPDGPVFAFGPAGVEANDYQVDYEHTYAPDVPQGTDLSSLSFTLDSASTLIVPGNRLKRRYTVAGTTAIDEIIVAVRRYIGGTVAVENGSQAVVGTGTKWQQAVVSANWLIVIGGVKYTVADVADDTHLTLTTPFAASTAAGLAYTALVKMPDATLNGLEWIFRFSSAGCRVRNGGGHKIGSDFLSATAGEAYLRLMRDGSFWYDTGRKT